jgi:hypothetical protein
MLPSPSRKARSFAFRSHWACPPPFRTAAGLSAHLLGLRPVGIPFRSLTRLRASAPGRASSGAQEKAASRSVFIPPSPARAAPWLRIEHPPPSPAARLPAPRQTTPESAPHLWIVRLLTPPASQASSLRTPGWAPPSPQVLRPALLRRGSRTAWRAVKADPCGVGLRPSLDRSPPARAPVRQKGGHEGPFARKEP